MTDFSDRHEVVVDAPVHTVAEYCRDPRRLYAGDPKLEVMDVTLTPEGAGTRARVVAKGFVAEEVSIEYVELVPDQRIVFEARPRVSVAGSARFAISFTTHVWTWTFAPEDGGTRLTLVIVEQDPPWWERAIDVVTQKMWAKEVRARLARIKAGAEEQAAAPG